MIKPRTVTLNSCLAIAVLLVLAGCGGRRTANLKFFRYNQASGLTSLDPAFAKDQSNIWACNQLFNSLLQLDDNLNIQPCIAKTWEISDDGKVYTFHLRTDVYFHKNACFKDSTGRPVTAADVVYSFTRIITPKTASPGAWIFNNNVDTQQPFKAVNDSTFQLTLLRPFRPMLGILTMQYCSVIPHEAVEYYGSSFRSNPVGTGPFMFKRWKEGTGLILVRNPAYFEQDSGHALPYLDGVKVSFMNSKKTEYLSFRQHELDFINSIDPSYIDQVLDSKGDMRAELKTEFNLLKTSYLNTEYLGFLMVETKEGQPPLPKAVRQAINYGFDRREMLNYLHNGVGKPAESGFTPYGLPSYTDSVVGYSYNFAKAQQLLKEAGYANGKGLPEIKLCTNATYQEYGLFIGKQLEKLGLKIKVEVVQPDILREWMRNGKVAFFRGSWLADYPDSENYMVVFYGKNVAPPNYTHFNNAQFDALYQQALSENNDSLRNGLFRQMERIIIEEAPVVPLFYDEIMRFTQKNVEGLSPNALNLLNLKKVKIK